MVGMVMLTREQIETAKGDRLHVAIRVLDDVGAKHWETLRGSMREAKDGSEQQRLCGEAFIPFAEALEGQRFTLQPLEIVSI